MNIPEEIWMHILVDYIYNFNTFNNFFKINKTFLNLGKVWIQKDYYKNKIFNMEKTKYATFYHMFDKLPK